MNALEKYPLPKAEANRLLKLIALSSGLWIVVGIILAVIITRLSTGSFFVNGNPLAWIDDIAAKMFPHWCMVVLPIVALATVEGVQAWCMPRSERFRASTYKVRQGITGEMPRCPALPMFFLMLLTGFSEEFVFRYGLIGLFTLLLAFVLPQTFATVTAVLLATLIFTVLHMQYKDTFYLAFVFLFALMMGIAFVLTGSLLSVAFAHGIYDFSVLLFERRNMVKESDYFAGEVPINALDKM